MVDYSSTVSINSEASPPVERSAAAVTPAVPACTGRHRLPYKHSGHEASRSQLSAAMPPGHMVNGSMHRPTVTAAGGRQHRELAIETPTDLSCVVLSQQGKSPPEQAVVIIGPFAREGAAELMRVPAAAEELL